MRGMNAANGAPLDGMDHLRQSVRDILLTPIGTRVMLREYGSLVARLLDQPVGAGWAARMRASVLDALSRWEPRLLVTRVAVAANSAGRVEIAIDGGHRDDGVEVELNVEAA